jgi:bifunctional non-homologous end joining protein LigD
MATKKLSEYDKKRDFKKTPEPSGRKRTQKKKPKEPRFVIHEHHARSLHWDLRLERDGVLVSWAVPKGIPPDPKKNHLAVHVEDHPLDYIDFAGEIPKGEYGAGTIKIWDKGTYEAEKWRDDEVILTFHGERLEGRYVLFQTKDNQWMIHRMDPPAGGEREPMPDKLVPMLAKLSALPRNDQDYGYEIKWDGIRALAIIDGGRVRLVNRNGRDATRQYPELRELGRAVGTLQLILDGEIVAFDENGRPSFERLQSRMHLASDSAIRRRMEDIPVAYMIFDVLFLEGHSTMQLPYTERRRLLDEQLKLEGPHWRTPSYHAGDGKDMLAASRERGLEGVIAKKLDSIYEPGRRSGNWLKIKNVQRQEVVIGGWMPGEGRRAESIGSLVVGYYDGDRLVYAGNVGSGFKEADLARLGKLLEPLRRKDSPFDGRQPKKGAMFVEPKLVAEAEFLEWTRAGTLRAPAFKGLRDDKDPKSVVREVPEPPPS